MKRLARILVVALLCVGIVFSPLVAQAGKKSIYTPSPSVERKEVKPVVKEWVDPKTGKKILFVAEIVVIDPDTQEEKAVKILEVKEHVPYDEEEPWIYVTPFAQRYGLAYPRLTKKQNEKIGINLDAAFGEILSVESLAELEWHLDLLAAKYNPTWDGRALFTVELFDVTACDLYMDMIRGGAKLRITFDYTVVNPQFKPIVMHLPEMTGKWTIIPDNWVTVNDDDTLTVIFDSLCPVVIISASGELAEEAAAQDAADIAAGREPYVIPSKRVQADDHGCGCDNLLCWKYCPWCRLDLCHFFCTEERCICFPVLIVVVLIIVAVIVVVHEYRKKKKLDDQKKAAEETTAHGNE